MDSCHCDSFARFVSGFIRRWICALLGGLRWTCGFGFGISYICASVHILCGYFRISMVPVIGDDFCYFGFDYLSCHYSRILFQKRGQSQKRRVKRGGFCLFSEDGTLPGWIVSVIMSAGDFFLRQIERRREEDAIRIQNLQEQIRRENRWRYDEALRKLKYSEEEIQKIHNVSDGLGPPQPPLPR